MFLKSYSKCSACLTNVGLVAILTWYLVDTFTDDIDVIDWDQKMR